MIVVGSRSAKFIDAPAEPVVMGLVFLAWGILLILYRARSYKGGAASIVGAILLGIGIWSVIGEVFWQLRPTVKEMWTAVAAEGFMVVAGTALLLQGHRIHRVRINGVGSN